MDKNFAENYMLAIMVDSPNESNNISLMEESKLSL